MTDLASRVRDASLRTGSFVLRSGEVSSRYFDKYGIASDPELLAEVAQSMAELLPEDTEVVAGLELGGIPVVTAVSATTGLPAAFVRKTAKPYGSAHLIEGGPAAGRRTVLIEDVVTTGGQVLSSGLHLRSVEAVVSTAVCIIDRQAGAPEALAREGIELRSVFTADQVADRSGA